MTSIAHQRKKPQIRLRAAGGKTTSLESSDGPTEKPNVSDDMVRLGLLRMLNLSTRLIT